MCFELHTEGFAIDKISRAIRSGVGGWLESAAGADSLERAHAAQMPAQILWKAMFLGED